MLVYKLDLTVVDSDGAEYLHLNFMPASITVNGVMLSQRSDLLAEGYTLRSLGKNDYAVNIKHTRAGKVIVKGE